MLLAAAVFVLFLVMSHFLFNPVRKLLEDRKTGIEKNINDAKEEKEEAESLKAEYESKLSEIEKEAETILSESRQKALKNETKIIEEAKLEASRIMKRAQEEAELEKKHAMDDLKQEIVAIASLMAEKVVVANINTDIQDRLVEETLKEIGESTWQN